MGNTVIIGAGESGCAIALSLLQQKRNVLGFVDDAVNTSFISIVVNQKKLVAEETSKKKWQVPLLGNCNNLASIVQQHKPKHLIVAVQNASLSLLAQVLRVVNTNYTHLYITPAYSENDFVPSTIRTNSASSELKQIATNYKPLFRKLQPEDLIGRRKLHFNPKLVTKSLKGKTALITGAGGSIGSVLCLQLLMFGLKKIIAVSRSEHSIFRLKEKIENIRNKNKLSQTEVIFCIGDVGDSFRLREIFLTNPINLIFHAAAHKHVPLMEENPKEAFKNNVLATLTLLKAAKAHRVQNFVLISTDKAVNPSTVMGRSKRIAELLTSSYNNESSLSCCIVRFGNVISSRGSVVPLFRRQIRKRIPITITHEKCERFFMTRSQAALLVLHAYALPKKHAANKKENPRSSTVYMLDMGNPVRIKGLVEMMLQLYGFIGKKTRPIKTIGLRTGEKLYEDLLGEGEVATPTECKEIFAVNSPQPTTNFVSAIQKLAAKLAHLSEDETKQAMLSLLPKTHIATSASKK